MARKRKARTQICDLPMISAEYRYVAKGKTRGFAYRIRLTLAGERRVRFDALQYDADQLANELQALAALIRAHASQRQSKH
jgi:hypothetical protein